MTDAMLETVTLVEKSIAEGASVATYVVRSSDQRKSRVATDYYLDTANAAWQVFIDELQVGITAQEESTQKQQALLSDCKAQLERDISAAWYTPPRWIESGRDMYELPHVVKWIRVSDIVREIGEAGMITGDRWWTNRDRG